MEFDLLGSLDPRRPAHSSVPAEPVAAPQPVCSRRGCGDPATWSLSWNNPRVHTPERRKVWLACDEHHAHLADFLGQRGFLKSVEPFREHDHAAPAPDEHDDAARTPGGNGGVVRGPRAGGEG